MNRIRARANILFVCCLAAAVFAVHAFAAAVEYPAPTGYINDYAGVVGSDTDAALESLCAAINRDTTAQIAVAVVNDLGGLDIDTYAVELFEKWKVGSADKDNGVLLVVALSDRKYRIEVGYGLEGRIPDIKANEIAKTYLVPNFKSGDYDAGIRDTVNALAAEVAAEYGKSLSDFGVEQTAPPVEDISGAEIARKLTWPQKIFAVIIFIIMLIIFIKNPSLFFLLLLSSRGGGGGWSSGGGGGFGGGFGGFGGGMSGGGGSSGSW